MRKLKLQMQVSVDGFVAGPEHQMDWMTWNWDEELKQYISRLTEPVDQIILGRRLAEGFIPAWEGMLANPDTADDFARKMVDTPKLIFSRTLKTIRGNNALLAQGDLTKEITGLKQQPGGDMMVYGGAGFVSELISHNLIDEYHLFINPTAIGWGTGIFSALPQYLKLNLISAVGFSCGVAALHYQPAL